MATKMIQKWGNSLGVRIPKELAERAHLHEGCAVEIAVEGDRVVLTPTRHKYSLDGLLALVSKDNLHGEIDTGEPAGDEIL